MVVMSTDRQDIRELVGRNIRLAREAKRLSQRQLAELIGSTRKSVGEWETGKHMPEVEAVYAIADALGRTAGWFYDPHLEAEL